MTHPLREEIIAAWGADFDALVATVPRTATAGGPAGVLSEAHDAPHAEGRRQELRPRDDQCLPDPVAGAGARKLCQEMADGHAPGYRLRRAGGDLRHGGRAAGQGAAGGRCRRRIERPGGDAQGIVPGARHCLPARRCWPGRPARSRSTASGRRIGTMPCGARPASSGGRPPSRCSPRASQQSPRRRGPITRGCYATGWSRRHRHRRRPAR